MPRPKSHPRTRSARSYEQVGPPTLKVTGLSSRCSPHHRGTSWRYEPIAVSNGTWAPSEVAIVHAKSFALSVCTPCSAAGRGDGRRQDGRRILRRRESLTHEPRESLPTRPGDGR